MPSSAPSPPPIASLGDRTREDPALEGMGTTLIALLRARDKLVLTHIGDSRAFLVREGAVTQITKDHSFVQSLVDDGRITQDEAQTHPQRSLVTKVLTGHPEDEPDVVVRQAIVGDRYLIASDGLTDYVARDTIDEVLTSTTKPADACERLVQLALKAGAPDNVTVVIGDVVDLRLGPVPSDVPQVVGAAGVTRRGTRPIPVTPAEKAAALTQEATGAAPTDDVELAEEGPPSLGGRLLRWVGALAALAIVVAGGVYAGWLWVQTQYWVGVTDGVVTLHRGVEQTIGPIALSRVERRTSISPNDLPEMYQTRLAGGIAFANRAAADELLDTLEVQARACQWFQSEGPAVHGRARRLGPPHPLTDAVTDTVGHALAGHPEPLPTPSPSVAV
jgi:Serine/threonine protein phosphatase